MLEQLSEHIENNLSFLKEKKLLIACSGGLDSIVLTHCFHVLSYDIALAHCNFELRGVESSEDEAFVRELAKILDVTFISERFDTENFANDKKLSVQMAARDLRYNWFAELLRDFKFDYLLTAHHADDDLETFLINLGRGTGLRGLTGIPEVNGKVVRPLLPFSRNEILEYATTNNIHWREDSSNSKLEYLRNRLRMEVIPNYKEVSRQLLRNFKKTRRHLEGSERLIDDYLALIHKLVVTETGDGYRIDLQKFSELPNKEDLLYELLSPFGFTAWDDLIDLLEAQSGKQILSATHRLIKDRRSLLLTKLPESDLQEEYFINKDETDLLEPVQLSFTPAHRFEITNAHTVFVDNELLTYPLKLRRWKEGDVFQPFGMEGKKKLSKFFKDEKLSLLAKDNTWILCSDDQIVWVVGRRLDDRFKVHKNTRSIMRIDFTPR